MGIAIFRAHIIPNLQIKISQTYMDLRVHHDLTYLIEAIYSVKSKQLFYDVLHARQVCMRKESGLVKRVDRKKRAAVADDVINVSNASNNCRTN